jgi:hypothetical protein
VDSAGNFDFALNRYNSDGTPDLTFGSGGTGTAEIDLGTDSPDSNLAVQSDGMIVLVGTRFDTNKQGYDMALMRLVGDIFSSSGMQDALNSQPPVDSATGNPTITLQGSTQTQANEFLALFQSPGTPGFTPLAPPAGAPTPIDISLTLASGISLNEAALSIPQGIRVQINGGTWYGGSPALTLSAGNLTITGATFLNATDAPTILVTGGSLTLRNDVIQESTGFTDAAISVTGGSLDLGTAASPGNNTINVNGTGQLVQNSMANSISAVGDTFEAGGVVLPAPTLSFTSSTTSVNPSTLNQPVTIVASIRPNGSSATPTGRVDFFDTTTNTDLGSVILSGGSASLRTSALAVGNHVIRVSYSGDSSFLPSLAVLSQQVHYHFSGFLAPLNSSMAIGLGRSVPIKFQLTDYNGVSISSLSAITSLQVLDNSQYDVLGGAGKTGLRYDPTTNQFVYNWQTKGLIAGNYYTIVLLLNDGTRYSKTIQLSASGGGNLLADSGTGAGQAGGGALLGGELAVFVDNSTGSFTSDELARVDDAIAALNAIVTPYGATIVKAASADTADTVLTIAATSPSGGAADGVLGCENGGITIVQGWNWYTGSNPATVGAGQYDFETIVMHELGHAVGLGHSANATSVMYATLTAGAADRTLYTADLNIPDADSGPCALHAASPAVNESVSTVSGPGFVADTQKSFSVG